MVRDTGIAVSVYTARTSYERMEIGSLPQECDEGVVGGLEESIV